jgi:glutamine amidotransferase
MGPLLRRLLQGMRGLRMNDVVVIDYGLGNLRSVTKAFEALGFPVQVSNLPHVIRAAARIVLPGVGAFGVGMDNLNRAGLAEVLREEVIVKGKPFLGICLGMQILAREGLENGAHEGLGWIPGIVRPLAPSPSSLRIPHVGWNEVRASHRSPLLTGLPEAPAFYFVHSYHLAADRPADILATCDYGGEFAAVLESGNIAATQFHPEKSQEFGLKFLENFMNWPPAKAGAGVPA